MTSITVLTLGIDDIKGHLKCDDDIAYKILGMAKQGKFADIIMDDFWLTLEALENSLRDLTLEENNFYEFIGRGINKKQEAEKVKKNKSEISPETIEKIYELAFGDEAINRNFSQEDLISTLKDFTDKSHLFEVMQTALQEEGWDIINKGASD